MPNATLSKMIATRIEFQVGRIARLADASDLAELLFPGNRNQQHAFLVVWIALKWTPPSLVPNVAREADQHQVSRRTLERVRAKLRRLGLIERISRFHARFAGCEGWALSPRFEHRLRQLANKAALLRSPETSSSEKDRLLVDLADARRAVPILRAPPTTRGE